MKASSCTNCSYVLSLEALRDDIVEALIALRLNNKMKAVQCLSKHILKKAVH